MKFMRRRATLAAAAAAFALPAGRAAAADPVKVGAIFPLSGGAGPQGQHVVQAIEAMAAMVNEAGGVLGRPVQILKRDDESTPAVGVSRANELIAEGVSVIIEGWNSPVTLAMQPVIARAGVLDITAISKADPILSGAGNPLAIRLNSSNAQDGRVIAEHMARSRGEAHRLPHPERRLRQRRPGGDRGRAEGAQPRLREGRRRSSSPSPRRISAWR